MKFDPPKTQEQLDEIMAVCKLTRFDVEGATRINNVYRCHIDPQADECGPGCSRLSERLRWIVSFTSQHAERWQATIAIPAVVEAAEPQAPKTKKKK